MSAFSYHSLPKPFVFSVSKCLLYATWDSIISSFLLPLLDGHFDRISIDFFNSLSTSSTQVYGSVVAGRYSNQHILPLAHMVVSSLSTTALLKGHI